MHNDIGQLESCTSDDFRKSGKDGADAILDERRSFDWHRVFRQELGCSQRDRAKQPNVRAPICTNDIANTIIKNIQMANCNFK